MLLLGGVIEQKAETRHENSDIMLDFYVCWLRITMEGYVGFLVWF